MRRIAHAQIGIPRLEHIDLVQLEVFARGRVLRDAGHQRKRLVAVTHEGDDIVEIVQPDAGGRADDRQVRGADFFQKSGQSVKEQEAIFKISNPSSTMRSTEVSSNGVHMGEKTMRLGRAFHQLAGLGAVEPGFRKALDIFDVHPPGEIGMNERVEVAILQFEGES